MPGTLYIVATPIGNLDDITYRALETFKKVDVILCEDTRATKKLLGQFGIETKTMSYHQHSGEIRKLEIRNLLEEGRNIALATDAGTPGISDPGNELIEQVVIGNQKSVIVPIPGPSAVTTALSVCGFPADKFLFLGFPPHKKGRQTFWKQVAACEETVVFYESPHRILKSLEQLRDVFRIPSPGQGPPSPGGRGEGEGRQIVVCRELTKMFESVYRGTMESILELVQQDPIKGEYVVIVGAA